MEKHGEWFGPQSNTVSIQRENHKYKHSWKHIWLSNSAPEIGLLLLQTWQTEYGSDTEFRACELKCFYASSEQEVHIDNESWLRLYLHSLFELTLQCFDWGDIHCAFIVLCAGLIFLNIYIQFGTFCHQDFPWLSPLNVTSSEPKTLPLLKSMKSLSAGHFAGHLSHIFYHNIWEPRRCFCRTDLVHFPGEAQFFLNRSK